ncbi:MAG: ATP-binding cassette domain-containing protein [candidate division Zixibacteria bacterium]|nr:ATP-binding cassette domain-containing protein [Candidatus Tariuqbacter arcticus]
MVEVNNLTKIFPGKKGTKVLAVDNLTFKCSPGEIYGLLGPNGAGKTTTLRMLSTALKPTEGSAVINGFDVVSQSNKVRSTVGFLSSATGLYRRLTGKEMIQYFGKLNGMKGQELNERVNQLMSLMDITPFANRKCDKLSTGQKQRVSICRCIVHDPPVMILDEPAEGLDIIAAEIIVEFIRECRNNGKCVIFSTHIMAEAETLCDRIGIINEGKLCAEGTQEALKTRFSADSLNEVFRCAVNDKR